MQEPYQSNPECHYQDQVPLEKKEIKLLLFWKIVFMIPLAIFSLLGFLLLASLYIDDGFTSFEWDMLLLPVSLMIFGISINSLFKREKYKEIFDSELTNYFGVIFLNNLWFKDSIGKMSLFPFFYKINRVKTGKKYRVHKLADKNLILRIEDVS